MFSFLTPTHGHISISQLAKTDIYQLGADTECNLEDLLREMDDRDRWWERV